MVACSDSFCRAPNRKKRRLDFSAARGRQVKCLRRPGGPGPLTKSKSAGGSDFPDQNPKIFLEKTGEALETSFLRLCDSDSGGECCPFFRFSLPRAGRLGRFSSLQVFLAAGFLSPCFHRLIFSSFPNSTLAARRPARGTGSIGTSRHLARLKCCIQSLVTYGGAVFVAPLGNFEILLGVSNTKEHYGLGTLRTLR